MPRGQSGPPPVRRHLMTPGQPLPPQRYSMSLTSVQRWVMSTLVAITILHMSAGLVVAAYFIDRQSSQIGLLVIAGAFGILAIEAALLIHRHRPVTAWALLGLIPALVGAWVIFG